MEFKLEPLPFEPDALEPFISARTVDIHYTRHHGGYVRKLDDALQEDPLRERDLSHIVLNSRGKTFNLAAQVWNHDFYWRSLSPKPTALKQGSLQELIADSLGGPEGFRRSFSAAAADEFGSGWAWLAFDPESTSLKVFSTTDAVNPLVKNLYPLLTLDVWEHAYYLDYQNDRGAYIDAFLQEHINWDFAQRNLGSVLQRMPAA